MISEYDDEEAITIYREAPSLYDNVDYTRFFTTDMVFTSRDELIGWVKKTGRDLNMVIVTIKSDSGGDGIKPRLTLGCERNGSYRPSAKKNLTEGDGKKFRTFTSAKKCKCPFKLNGRKLNSENEWKLEVLCASHNHAINDYLEGHSYVGRLIPEEYNLVQNLSDSLVAPKQILYAIKQKFPNNKTTIKTLYNARTYYKMKKKAGKSQMQYLFSKLEENNYIEFHRCYFKSEVIQDLFWAHPRSVDLLRSFPNILIMDCTYKTVRYGLPLLQIVGVTSTEMTFSVANAYLSSEKEETYNWALSKLLEMMRDYSLPPKVIVTDRDLALMNAVKKIFPSSNLHLCRWHISKNILTKCKKKFDAPNWKKFCEAWSFLISSSTILEYNERLLRLKKDFSKYPFALKYIETSWLTPHREKFVAAWIDMHMHNGNTTSNRAESAHAALKRQIKPSIRKFDECWAKMHSLFELTFTEIKTSFEKSKMMVQHEYTPVLFGELRTFISLDALHEIYLESKRAKLVGVDVSACGCVIRKTHGLPCAHEISGYIRDNKMIPLECVNAHWRKLDIEHVMCSNDNQLQLSIEPDIELLRRRFHESGTYEKLQLFKKLKELVDPACNSIIEPIVMVKTKGRQSNKRKNIGDTSTKRNFSAFEYIEQNEIGGVNKKNKNKLTSRHTINNVPQKLPVRKKGRAQTTSCNATIKYINQFSENMRTHIESVKDVIPDGNCGFRAIADLVSNTDMIITWERVRQDLLNELETHWEIYMCVFGSIDRVNEIKHALLWTGIIPAPIDKWMTIPDMGHLIASRYSVVLHTLSPSQNLTFLPLRTEPVEFHLRKHIAIGFVDGVHFVEVFLKAGYPIPQIHLSWYYYHFECAEGWDVAYLDKIKTVSTANVISEDRIIEIKD